MRRLLTLLCPIIIVSSVSFCPLAAQVRRTTPHASDCTQSLCTFATAWMTPDTSAMTATLMATLRALNGGLSELPNSQQINQLVLGSEATPQTLPDANDLVYSTLWGQPYFSSLPASPLNYVMNASGANSPHVFPKTDWSGRAADQAAYARYIQTVLAVESFNAYVLDSHATDLQASFPAHQELLSQAADADGAAVVASEEIGPVLRQLLLVERQNLALLSQLVQTQKQLVAAQAMTNALLIATSPVESQLLAKAIGVPPSQKPPVQTQP